MIDNLPQEFLTKEKSLSKLDSNLLKLCIPFIRIAHIPGYGHSKVKDILYGSYIEHRMNDMVWKFFK